MLAVLLLAGCSSKYLGHYEGRQPQPDAPENMAETIAQIKLDLRSDGRFTYIRFGFPWEGEWAVDGGRIKLIVDSAMNKEADPLGKLGPGIPVLEPKEDGSLLVFDAFSKEGVILKRTGESRPR